MREKRSRKGRKRKRKRSDKNRIREIDKVIEVKTKKCTSDVRDIQQTKKE